MNEIWKSKVEISNIVYTLRELTKVLSIIKMCFNREVRLARGVQMRYPHKTTKWAGLLKAFWAKEYCRFWEP